MDFFHEASPFPAADGNGGAPGTFNDRQFREPGGGLAMRSSFASQRGLTLLKTPNAREQAGRRRLAVACAMAGLALVSGLIGTLTHAPTEVAAKSTTGPFSYFPTE
jgi:hypothetical protein